MSSGRETRRQAMKVTIIETQFVQTDAAQFKMVVQKFTGKDSVMAFRGQERRSIDRRKREVPVEAALAAAVAAGGEEMWPSVEELHELLGDL